MNKVTENSIKSSERITLFAEVLLPVPVPGYYTYRIPFEWNDLVTEGVRAIVQFGPKKILTGIVMEVHQRPPDKHQAKYILEILDPNPVVSRPQVALFKWMAGYYMCTQGQVMQVALPSGLKLSSQSKIQLDPNFARENLIYPLSQEEEDILEILEDQQIADYQYIQDKLGIKSIHKWVKSLLGKNVVLLFEEVKEKYQPKREKRIRLTPEYQSESALRDLLDSLEKKPKQCDLLLHYLHLLPLSRDQQAGIGKTDLLSARVSESSLKTLKKNGVLEEFEILVSRFPLQLPEQDQKIELSKAQCQARDEILECFQNRNIVMLHGITGSGKTEIYMDLIKEVLAAGSQVLYLLPEIALTTQIVSRLKKVFGSAMGVYHSRFSDNERVEVWRGVLEGRFNLVVGVRSSVFLPFDDLGLVIVDEEHELSYKQFDPAPRYHARDVALFLAKLHHAKTLLGSATPSVESYYHAQQEKYALVELHERFNQASLPQYHIIDTATVHAKSKMQGDFSGPLLEAIGKVLDNQKQAIIFQNRRGYAPFLQCETCGHIPQCTNCSVSLTYHMHFNQLKCHYCGYREKMPTACVSCNSQDLELKGFGTEKLEEEIKEFFPNARVQRMDLDTTRRKYGYQQIIDQFEAGAIDILVGTQMVTKGLDFDHVALVGVLDIDRIIHFPDFRSFERAFQLISQVGGRAGRKSGQGQVFIQTKNPGHPLLALITDHDYHTFYQRELPERRKFVYPPFVRLLRLTVKGDDRKLTAEAAKVLGEKLVEGLGRNRILGPQEPLISKIRNQYLMVLYVKLAKSGGAPEQVKGWILQMIYDLIHTKGFRSVRIVPDVDPY